MSAWWMIVALALVAVLVGSFSAVALAWAVYGALRAAALCEWIAGRLERRRQRIERGQL